MGANYSRLAQRLSSPVVTHILILGPDAAGKTTLLYSLHLGDVITTIPHIGITLETVTYKEYCEIDAWDLSLYQLRNDAIRSLFATAKGVVFVVDSNDRDRIDEVRIDFHAALEKEELGDAPVLILANKQDLPRAMSVEEIGDRLEVRAIRGRNWKVIGSSVLRGTGVYEGFDWLTNGIARKANYTADK